MQKIIISRILFPEV